MRNFHIIYEWIWYKLMDLISRKNF